MKLKIPDVIAHKLGRQILTVQKNSPHILFVAGVVGIVGTTILASRATLKLGAVLEEAEYEIQGVKTDLKDTPGYTKDLAYVYTKNTIQVARLYAPAVLLGGVSIGMLTGSHVQLTRRNSALTAAYAAISTAYDNYRVRVRDAVGEEKELDLYRGISIEKIMNAEGKLEKMAVAHPDKVSAYARFFDECSTHFVKNAEYNKLRIMATEAYMNDLLRSRGHVFLNEVYYELGFEHTPAGAIVGWVIGPEGDNFIDFGLTNVRNARFLNSYERVALLDFNVDGIIFDKI